MNEQLLQIIEQIGREKGITADVLFSAVEEAVQSACQANLQTPEKIVAQVDRQTGLLKLFTLRQAVDRIEDEYHDISLEDARLINPNIRLGGVVRIELMHPGLGRIAAKAARAVLTARVREAEHDSVFRYYAERLGQAVSGVVQRVEKGLIIVDLGRAEAIVPRGEQSPRDSFKPADRIKAYLSDIRRTALGTQIVLSRTHPGLIVRLFEMEVPEIYERVVEIKGAVREAGERAKLCVSSNDANVDPVGACVGMRGARVQAVVRELGGENIDIVEWAEDASTFIGRSLSPATVSRITLNHEARSARVVVADSNLSLAIGKRGQNVRLAAKLTGWRIDIRSESESEKVTVQETQRQAMLRAEIATLPDVGAALADLVMKAGYDTVGKLASAVPKELLRIEGMGMVKAELMIEHARQLQQKAVTEPPKGAPSPDSDIANDGFGW